ncbi:MAG: hypothetical protein RQ875_08905 [Vicingaceae bacterium]|nr:hypothetical protein [Vicingaceae bacterium]
MGNKDACLIYDATGKLMKGTELITDINTACKPIIVNLTGSNKYALITLNNTNTPNYHIIDMNLLGYGTMVNAGEVENTLINQPLTTNTTAQYGLHFTGFEDHVNGKTVVYTTRYVPLIPNGEGITEIVAYEFTGANTTPQEHVLYSLNSCADTKQGELQIAQDGTKLLWYHHNEYVAGFNHRVAQIYEIELDASKTAITGNVEMINTSAAGNFGNGNVEGGTNSSDILYAQRGVYKEAKTQDPLQKTEKNVWKYDPINEVV